MTHKVLPHQNQGNKSETDVWHIHDSQKETCMQKMGPLAGKLAILEFWAFH